MLVDLSGLNIGLLVLRVLIGFSIAAHGGQKLFGWFGGYGLAGTGGFLEQLGFRPGRMHAFAAGSCELLGGLGLALGLATPIASALILCVMLTAMFSVHWQKGFFITEGGLEHVLAISAAALALAFTGPGAYSLDNVIGIETIGWQPGIGALIVGLVASIGALVVGRRRPEHA